MLESELTPQECLLCPEEWGLVPHSGCCNEKLKRVKFKTDKRRHFVTQCVIRLPDSLPSDVTEAKNLAKFSKDVVDIYVDKNRNN